MLQETTAAPITTAGSTELPVKKMGSSTEATTPAAVMPASGALVETICDFGGMKVRYSHILVTFTPASCALYAFFSDMKLHKFSSVSGESDQQRGVHRRCVRKDEVRQLQG